MIFTTLEQARQALACATEVITDSRSLLHPTTTVFAAVRTATGDGHRYITDMYLKGVRYFIVNEIPPELTDKASANDSVFIIVDNVREAIAALGASCRKNLASSQVIAITGSRGKTEVKELIYSALLKVEKPMRSPRSWNSHIGTALSLLEITPDTDHAVIEVGIDGPDQIDDITLNSIRPGVGILCSITDTHDSGFSTRLQKIEEKAKLFAGCKDIIFDSQCDPEIKSILSRQYPEAQLHPVSVDHYTPDSINRALAAKTLEVIGYGDRTEQLLSEVKSVNSRIDVHEGINNCLMLFDNFTCDLSSLRNALDYMRRRAGADRSLTVILGDLSHWYGADIDELYRKADSLIHDFKVSRLIGVGKEINRHRHCFDRLIANDFMDSAKEFVERYDMGRFNSELILIKGPAGNDFELIKDVLETPRHDTIMEINLDAIARNFNYYKSQLKPQTGLIAMVKASAYGVGALEPAKTLQNCRAAYLAVAVVDEGVALRQAGITMPILVLNPVTNNYSALFDRHLEPTIFSLNEYFTLRNEARRRGLTQYPIHIKLDTGMHRLGFIESEIDALCDYLSDSTTLRVASVFSHLATADCLDMNDYTELQLSNFERMSGTMLARLPYKFKRHILNTAGISRYPEYQYDMVRLGIGMYGIDPCDGTECSRQEHLSVVARLSTTILAVRRWPAGTTIGYGRRGLLQHDSVIATVPIGYADGIDRHFGCGAASFKVNGVYCPTVGSICMDLCMIDVSEVPDVKVGDIVEIFGPDAPVQRLSRALGTIPYEILTSVSPRVRRIYFRE